MNEIKIIFSIMLLAEIQAYGKDRPSVYAALTESKQIHRLTRVIEREIDQKRISVERILFFTSNCSKPTDDLIALLPEVRIHIEFFDVSPIEPGTRSISISCASEDVRTMRPDPITTKTYLSEFSFSKENFIIIQSEHTKSLEIMDSLVSNSYRPPGSSTEAAWNAMHVGSETLKKSLLAVARDIHRERMKMDLEKTSQALPRQ